MNLYINLKFKKDINFSTNTFKRSGCENQIGEMCFYKVESNNINEHIIDKTKAIDESKILTFDFDSVESIDNIINVLKELKEKMNKAISDDDFYESSLLLAKNC